jgi:hypothetical protein
MKTHLVSMGLVLACPLAALAQVALPEAAPGPFAPVPARITKGPEAPAKPMEDKAPTLESCKNSGAILKDLGIRLSDEQKALLGKQRFILLPIKYTSLAEKLPTTDEDREWAFTSDEMLTAFERLGGEYEPSARQSSNARLITPDVALHAWHRGFSRTLEFIEQRRLHEVLASFLQGTLANTRELRADATGPLAERLAWTEARFATPWILLGNPAPPDERQHSEDSEASEKTPPPTYQKIVFQRLAEARSKLPAAVGEALAKEIELVLAAEGLEKSPLFGSYSPDKPADYSQFKPRSHYTKSDALGGYFRAMMFLGRNGYDLKPTNGIGDALLATIVMARTPKSGTAPIASWKDLMEITGFFAGQSDDVTYTEFRSWIGSTLESTSLNPAAAVSEETCRKLAANLTKLRPPLIVSAPHLDQNSSPDSDAPSFRIFGQRFSWDARILDRFTRGSPQEMPSTPTAVMVTAAFGDEHSTAISRKFVAGNPAHAPQFEERLPEVRKELAQVTDKDWFASMAAKQLHVISTLARTRNANFPSFMSNDAFRAKNIDSMLGSFTELKHDTVLYAKQVYAEAGEGGESDKVPPAVKGFIQPDVPFWREMERLAVFTADGFARHKLLPDADEEYSRFRNFAADMKKFRIIAEKHVSGTPLTGEDWEAIRTTNLSYLAAPVVPFEEPKPGDGKCALVTDILTDLASGNILFQALGRPYVMLALVGGKDGNRMVAGLAYNYFEFAKPLAQGRLTDEDWQTRVYKASPDLPEKASWQTPSTRPQPVK